MENEKGTILSLTEIPFFCVLIKDSFGFHCYPNIALDIQIIEYGLFQNYYASILQYITGKIYINLIDLNGKFNRSRKSFFNGHFLSLS